MDALYDEVMMNLGRALIGYILDNDDLSGTIRTFIRLLGDKNKKSKIKLT